MGKQWKQCQSLFLGGSKITADGDCCHEIKTLTPWKESYDQPRQHIKKQRHYFANKGPCQGYGFASSHVQMWEMDYKESRVPKSWCFWTVVLEKTLESSLDCKEIQSVRPKGNQSWIFIGRTDVEAETRILWPPDTKSWLIWKDPDVGVMPKSRNLPMTTREPISDARARVCITKLELGLPPILTQQL